MLSEEVRFLQAMDAIREGEKAWLASKPHSSFVAHYLEPQVPSSAVFISWMESSLRSAGLIIGLNTRWQVYASLKPFPDVAIIPKNGAANQMLHRYDNLVLERELSLE